MSISNVHTINLPVEGMTCARCVLRVEKALKKVDGVMEANVNLATEKVLVSFDEKKTGLQALSTAVADAGYTLLLPDVGAEDAGNAALRIRVVKVEPEAVRRPSLVAGG